MKISIAARTMSSGNLQVKFHFHFHFCFFFILLSCIACLVSFFFLSPCITCVLFDLIGYCMPRVFLFFFSFILLLHTCCLIYCLLVFSFDLFRSVFPAVRSRRRCRDCTIPMQFFNLFFLFHLALHACCLICSLLFFP
jgi:hypothetical protein